MRPHLSLANQILFLVIVPLALQIGMLVWLASLLSDYETDLKVAARAGRIADTVHALCADVYEAMAQFSQEKHMVVPPSQGAIDHLAQTFNTHYETLKFFTKDNATEYEAVQSSERAAKETLKILQMLEDSLHRHDSDAERLFRKPLWKQLRVQSKKLLDKDLISLGANQKVLFNKGPEIQAKTRARIQQSIFLAQLFNTILIVLAAVFLTRGFVTKINRLNDNALRLASDMPLNPVLEGQDELSALDRVFHSMASELRESARKERALVDNARDLICSIDEGGRFVAVNPASKAILGFEPQELLGSHLIDLIASKDAGKTLSYLDRIKETGDSSPLELTLKRKGGTNMDAILSAHFARDEGSIFCVVHDITERKQAERLRQEVVAMVTHDLRTPLGTVKNVLDFLEGGTFGNLDEKGNRYVASGQRNVDRMMTLINDLLDVEKISSGRMELDISQFELNDCFDACLELHGGMAEEMGVKLVAEPTDIVLKADQEKIQRVMSNLVSNAIKFTERDKTVSISAENKSGETYIYVEDEGSGIPSDQLDSVFERFQQVHGAAKKLGGGSGLGLAICKAIVELHSGKIWVESELGKGSKFIVTVPSNR